MLSKLLSNINAGNTASGEETVKNKEGGMGSSEQIFKSLLQSLQNEGSSGKAEQPLLTLSDNSSEEGAGKDENLRENILGGSFTVMGEEEAEILQHADKNILKELQKEFQNIKNELTGEASNTSSEGEGKVKDEQSAENVPEQNTGNDESENTDQSVAAETIVSKDIQKNVEGAQKGQVSGKGRTKEAETEQKSVSQKQDSKMILQKQASENLKGTNKEKNTESDNKIVETRVGSRTKNIKEGDRSSPENKENTKPVTNSKKSEILRENKQVFQKVDSSSDMKGAAQNNSVEQLQNAQASTKEVIESQEKASPKGGIDTREARVNNQGKLFEKGHNLAGRQGQFDAVRQSEEGQILKNQNMKAGKAQSSIQIDGGETTKTELTEQQKKVMGSLLQKNNTTNISAKGLELKSVQNEKGEKNRKGKNKIENSGRGFGKQSTEGRKKMLSRLGISGTNAQKQAKPMDMQNFSGVSVGESNLSLEEQKINWEEQITKSMDSSSEKESKASSGSGSMRLGRMPITNVSLRKKILPGLTQNIQKAASSAKENAGNWQKHNFTLDDGKNIQLSVRESKGVLQVKMGSMNVDLSKLLQQNLQQIREHLRQEFGSDIDLQFDNQQQGEESQLFGDTEQSDRKRDYRNNFASEGKAAENVENISTKTVRNFGYNQMEWTA